MAVRKIKKKIGDYGAVMVMLIVLMILALMALLIKAFQKMGVVPTFPEPAQLAVDYTIIFMPAIALAVAGILLLPLSAPLAVIAFVMAVVYAGLVTYNIMNTPPMVEPGGENGGGPNIGTPTT